MALFRVVEVELLGARHAHDDVEDAELAGGERADHRGDDVERPEGIEAGTARLVGTDKNRIVSEIFSLLDDEGAYNAMARAHNRFGDGRAAERIAEIVARAD